ncbi:U1 zinc finger-domain-containing protein [Baffinella frigidus]|nr:U1 zinc finger-domain-containing protein [Cryptophyta sp. CCMP2293]
MPRYYCDYCDAFLTHDSPSVRKQHNSGRKHRDNVSPAPPPPVALVPRFPSGSTSPPLSTSHSHLPQPGAASAQLAPGVQC